MYFPSQFSNTRPPPLSPCPPPAPGPVSSAREDCPGADPGDGGRASPPLILDGELPQNTGCSLLSTPQKNPWFQAPSKRLEGLTPPKSTLRHPLFLQLPVPPPLFSMSPLPRRAFDPGVRRPRPSYCCGEGDQFARGLCSEGLSARGGAASSPKGIRDQPARRPDSCCSPGPPKEAARKPPLLGWVTPLASPTEAPIKMASA